MEPAVQAAELSKHYKIYRRPADRFLEWIARRPRHTIFPALQEITFDVEQGETIGIIGQNGAGKSTLLKLLCGVTQPTGGHLSARGKIASILELGTGFHPEFSGRDNAALNAALLGLSQAEIRRALPEIIDFSELGAFIDRPVKTYSSGMYMRLAFSVAVNVDPDILVIDEALAVGDGHFQKKCVDKIREFQNAGKTILFCSHSLYLVSSICRRAMWLDQGTMMRIGPAIDVVHEYETFLLKQDREHPASDAGEAADVTRSPVRFSEIVIADRHGRPRDRFGRGEEIQIRLRIASEDPDQPLHALVGVHRSADDLQCFAVGTHPDGLAPLSGSHDYELTVRLLNVPLLRGEYSIIAFVGDEHAITVFDRRDLRPAFSMSGDRFEVGLIDIDHRWESTPLEDLSVPVSTSVSR